MTLFQQRRRDANSLSERSNLPPWRVLLAYVYGCSLIMKLKTTPGEL